MTFATDSLFEQLRELLPDDCFQESASALAAFQSDGLTAFAVQPKAVVVPRTTEQVVEIVRWCHRNQVPFVARGSGTSLSGGSLPHADGIVIALNRMNRILQLDLPNRLAVVDPGVI
jgi:glycolate oxidase